MKGIQTCLIQITGLVQGVGFRPFVFLLAKRLGIVGTVSNNNKGVEIVATANAQNMQKFYQAILLEAPHIADIHSHSLQYIDLQEFYQFEILNSSQEQAPNFSLTPDFALCQNCRNEMQDPLHPKYNYPFTSCTQCGPRWAISIATPYERSRTSMHLFGMCTVCKNEYDNPCDRRFHSQTNSCPNCGISIFLKDNNGNHIASSYMEVLSHCKEVLETGQILAVKNNSGFLLCVDATNTTAIQRLRARKKRPKKPFAILYPNLKLLEKDLFLSKEEVQILSGPQSPICILSAYNYQGTLAMQDIAPGLQQLGVMIPHTALLQFLMQTIDFPLVATSGNLHASPILADNNTALEQLENIADAFLMHNLKIQNPQDDSVVRFSPQHQHPILIRRARGYAPNYTSQQFSSKQKPLALGAHLKSSIAFLPNKLLYLSAYMGNLDHWEVCQKLEERITYFQTLFRCKANPFLIDKHPKYYSNILGKNLSQQQESSLQQIQHHKAHFAAIMGEHQLFHQHVLGVVFDGSGYGDDDHIWGGEFFDYHNHRIQRINHLSYFDWILGDKMAREPRISLLVLSSPPMQDLVQSKFTEIEWRNYQKLLQTNSLKTSSIGRLFDAVASLLGLCDRNTYEAEAALLLENFIGDFDSLSNRSYFENEEFDPYQLLEKCYIDLEKGTEKQQIALNFLFSISSYIFLYAKKNNYNHIAFSGGVFQNALLVDLLISHKEPNLQLYFHQSLAANDENIAFGQIMYHLQIQKH
ncbi:MAG: carbamoyltransferase HypF [Flavobacteriaceae bacterium]|nr:carbamoyltransferase HypF [Flavobacteriaceae bacterium]